MTAVIAGVVLLAVFAVLIGTGWFVRRRDNEMDYPEAHGKGLPEGERNVALLGANSAWSGTIGLGS